MNRVTSYKAASMYEAAMIALPEPARRLVRDTHLFVGDPIAGGLHNDKLNVQGLSYRAVNHAVFPERARDRWPTVVIASEQMCFPSVATIEVMIHELAHVVDWRTGAWMRVPATSEYGKTDEWEAVAEALMYAWTPGRPDWRLIVMQDPEVRYLVEWIERGAMN